MARKALMHAVRDAFFEEMRRDPRLIVFGEDIIVSLFGDTRGLRDEFGPSRVRDTPISEGALTQMAVGVAMTGRPVICHLMFSNFIYTGFDGLANQAAKLRFMTGGQATLPLTYFAVMGGGASNAAQHSDTPYPVIMNLGGINVVVPTTPSDAKGLLKYALRGLNPTVYLVPRSRSGVMGEVPDEDYVVPFGQACIHRKGKDVTIVAIGSGLKHALAAAEALVADGIEAEVIDPRTLVPLDRKTILESVSRTGRLVVVDEARDTCSAASQIAAVVADEGYRALKAPIRRITVPDMPLPYAPVLEKSLVPDPDKIITVARELVKFR